MDAELLSCGVCYHPFSSANRPFVLGSCGHSFCEQCIKGNPRSFRYCPECRTRASNPSANIALLRLVEAAAQQQQGNDAGGAASSSTAAAAGARGDGQPQQRRPHNQQPAAGGRPAGAPSPLADILNAGPGNHPQGRLGGLLNKLPGSMPVGAVMAAAGGGAGAGAAQAGGGSVAAHQAKIAQLRTSMWVYLTPLLGLLYLVSPLDLVPDFLPVIGWLDDLLVLWYVGCTVYGAIQARTAAASGDAGTSQQQQQPPQQRRQ